MIRKDPASKACDVYSFGIFLWEILTWKEPFPDVIQFTLLQRVLDGMVGHIWLYFHCDKYYNTDNIVVAMFCCILFPTSFYFAHSERSSPNTGK